MNICMNKTNNTLKLYEIIKKIDVNDFEKALNKAIIFVDEAIKPANKIKFDKKQLHTKSQILSMIGRIFRFMYKDLNLKELSEDWNKKTIDILQKNLLHYYIFDNMTKIWYQGGDNYSFAVAQNNRYLTMIDKKQWNLALESYFENSLTKEETTKVSKPSNVSIAMLNMLYDEELINKSIGVEYLIPKEYSKYLVKMYNISLPISSIANLCYLPNSNKRSKKENIRNFYEDKAYIKKFYTEELEQKYTFTSQNDFDFLKEKYTNEAVLKDRYKIFLKNRFIQLKTMFLEKMDIK